MKNYLIFAICAFFSQLLLAQSPEILDTRVSLSETTDTLIVNYGLIGDMPHLDVELQVTDSLGNSIETKSLSGDLGNIIYPEKKEKTIYWDMRADGANLHGETIYVTVKADVLLYPDDYHAGVDTVFIEEDVLCYFPWLLVASGVSAAGGTYAWILANQAYDDYQDADLTPPAEGYREDVRDYDTIRNYAFGAAAVFGIAGTWIHIRHREKKRALNLAAMPLPDGGAISISFNF